MQVQSDLTSGEQPYLHCKPASIEAILKEAWKINRHIKQPTSRTLARKSAFIRIKGGRRISKISCQPHWTRQTHCWNANFIIVYHCCTRDNFFCNTVNGNSTIYSNPGTKEVENKNVSTRMITNRERDRKRLLKLNCKSEASNPNRKRAVSNTAPSRRLPIMKPYSKETSLKDIEN